MYDGTLYGQWEAIVTLQQMLVLCSPDGVLDMTPQAIAARTSIPFDIITKGIGILSQPDPYSRTPGEEGKRIVPIDNHRPWGWVIVNYRKYRDMQTRAQKNEADRVRIAEKRKANKSNDVATCSNVSQPVADVAHADADATTDTDTDTEAKNKGAARPPAGDLKTLLDIGVAEQHAKDWLKVRKAKRAPLTDTVIQNLHAQASKAGISVAQAVEICAKKCWQGFNADWDWQDGVKKSTGPPWWSSDALIEAKGREVGITPVRGESWQQLKGRIQQKIDGSPKLQGLAL